MCPSLCRDGCTALSELWGELAFDSEDVLNEEIVKGLGKEVRRVKTGLSGDYRTEEKKNPKTTAMPQHP